MRWTRFDGMQALKERCEQVLAPPPEKNEVVEEVPKAAEVDKPAATPGPRPTLHPLYTFPPSTRAMASLSPSTQAIASLSP